MRRIGAVIAAVVLVLALTASTALANPPGVTGTLDQRQIVFTANSAVWDSTVSLGQTFTAGMTGTLDAVGVYVGVTTPPPPPAVQLQPAVIGDTRIEVWNTSSGLPSGLNPIASETLNLVGLPPGAVYFEIPSPPNVVAGTQYLILVAETGSDLLNWYGDCTSDNYTGGQALVFTAATHTWQTVPAWSAAHSGGAGVCQHDFTFSTYVTAAPAPTTAPTLPPTSTATPSDTGTGGQAVALIVACFAAAAAFVTMRRYGLARR